LAPFVDYVKARFVDDPHLWASALFDEVVPLRYVRNERLEGVWFSSPALAGHPRPVQVVADRFPVAAQMSGGGRDRPALLT
jgi:hypothetical protein